MARGRQFDIPKYASLVLKPLLPWSKLLWVMASHLISSGSIVSPPGPRKRLYMASRISGRSLTFHMPRLARLGTLMEKGIFILSGVYDQRGRSLFSCSLISSASDRRADDVDNCRTGA